MGAWLFHWLYLDFWCPVWPNLAAAALCSTAVYMKLKARQERHRLAAELAAHRRHEELKRHITKTLGGQ